MGADKRAECLAAAVAGDLAQLRELRAKVTKPARVMFVMSLLNGRAMAAGKNTAANEIIALAGGVNAIDGYAGYRPLTPEAVIASRADYILVPRQSVESLGGVDKVLDQPAIRQTPAGRAGKVLQFDILLLLGFGPRTPQAATELASALHPELAKAN